MVQTVSSKKRAAVFLIILLIGVSAVSLGSYLTLTYTEGKEVVLLPYPSYSTEKTVTGTLTPGNPDFTRNISYYSLYDLVGSLFSGTPLFSFTSHLVGYFEADDNLSFYISLGEVAGYSGYGLWELRLHSDSASSVNFTIHYYREIHGSASFLVGQGDRIISGAQIHMYNDSCLMLIWYESTMLYVNVGSGLLFAVYSLGGMQNLPILYSSYILIIFGGATALGAAISLRRERKKDGI
jgi:hypothetical protein